MASISSDKRGNRRILFCTEDGRRPQITLGKVPMKAAETVKTKVETIIERRGLHVPLDAETVLWLQEIPDKLAGKLAAVGLMEPREKTEEVAPVRLGKFIDRYISMRSDVKRNTLRTGRRLGRCWLRISRLSGRSPRLRPWMRGGSTPGLRL